MVSMKDLAQMTGYSAATISRVINHSPKVSEETRRRVEEAIRSTGYHPNFIGRNLRCSSSMKVLVLLPTMENTFYGDVLRGAEDCAMEHGYQIVIGVTHNRPEVENAYVEMLRSRQVDGIIIANTSMDKHDLNRLAESFPVTLLAHGMEGAHASCVTIDNISASREAVALLTGLGHRRVAMISGYYYRNPSLDRETGYQAAMAAAGLACDPALLMRTDFDFRSGYQACKKLMDLEEPPTAIFCVADSIAIGAIRCLVDQGLDGRVSVVGFDNVVESEFFHHGVTTVSQPKYDLGRESMRLLFEKVQDLKSPPRTVVLGYEIVQRGSTRAVCPETDGT